MIEFFSGKRRVARLGDAIGLKTAAHDILYDETFDSKSSKKSSSKSKSAMDINTSAGFLFLGHCMKAK